jgi:hypothetical protein
LQEPAGGLSHPLSAVLGGVVKVSMNSFITSSSLLSVSLTHSISFDFRFTKHHPAGLHQQQQAFVQNFNVAANDAPPRMTYGGGGSGTSNTAVLGLPSSFGSESRKNTLSSHFDTSGITLPPYLRTGAPGVGRVPVQMQSLRHQMQQRQNHQKHPLVPHIPQQLQLPDHRTLPPPLQQQNQNCYQQLALSGLNLPQSSPSSSAQGLLPHATNNQAQIPPEPPATDHHRNCLLSHHPEAPLPPPFSSAMPAPSSSPVPPSHFSISTTPPVGNPLAERLLAAQTIASLLATKPTGGGCASPRPDPSSSLPFSSAEKTSNAQSLHHGGGDGGGVDHGGLGGCLGDARSAALAAVVSAAREEAEAAAAAAAAAAATAAAAAAAGSASNFYSSSSSSSSSAAAFGPPRSLPSSSSSADWSTGHQEMLAFLRQLTKQEKGPLSSLSLPGTTGGGSLEQDHRGGGDGARMATTVPVELLSEWAMGGLKDKDCACLGCALTIAAACGYDLGSL